MHERSPYAFRATLTPEPEGGFTVTFPDVPEAITYGADEREAMEMASEVLELAIVARMEQGEDLPPQQSGASDDLLVPLRPLLGAKAALRENLPRCAIDGLFVAADKRAVSDFPAMTLSEVQAEVNAVRSQRRHASGA